MNLAYLERDLSLRQGVAAGQRLIRNRSNGNGILPIGLPDYRSRPSQVLAFLDFREFANYRIVNEQFNVDRVFGSYRSQLDF